MTFSKTYGNVLINMVQNFNKSIVACIVTPMVTRGNPW